MKKVGQKIFDTLFPKNITCYCCGKELNEDKKFLICDDCFSALNLIKNPCQKCGDNIVKGAKYCFDCKDKVRHFDKVASVVVYDNLASKLVYNFKYGKNKYIGEIASMFMFEKLKEQNFKIDFVTSVPLNFKRQRIRGFNQAGLLARRICEMANLDYKENVLIRIKNTLTQTHLTFLERRENLKNAFVVNENVEGKNILIVDDIYTTGATMDEIARVLKIKKAGKVFGLTFCHTAYNKEKT